MPMLMKHLLARCLAPVGDVADDTGGTATLEAEEQPVEDRGDEVAPELNAESLQALVDQEREAGADEAAAAAASEEAQAGTTAGIPKSRFNEVNEQRKQAQADLEAARLEILRLQAEKAAPAAAAPAPAPAANFDEDAQEQAYMDALIDGDTKKAAGIRREINAHLREQATAVAREEAERVRQEDLHRAAAHALQAEAAVAVKAYPYLNTPDGAEALELITAARDAKIARGMPAHEALREAVKVIAPRFAPADGGTPAKDLPEATGKGDSRSAAAVARGAAASVAQPAQLTGGVGERAESGRINVERMTDDQFATLSEAEKRKLRGD